MAMSGNIEHYDKRFGVIAVEKGYLSSVKLIEALKVQVEEDVARNTHRLIGEILLDLDHMSVTQIQDVLDDIFKKKLSE